MPCPAGLEPQFAWVRGVRLQLDMVPAAAEGVGATRLRDEGVASDEWYERLAAAFAEGKLRWLPDLCTADGALCPARARTHAGATGAGMDWTRVPGTGYAVPELCTLRDAVLATGRTVRAGCEAAFRRLCVAVLLGNAELRGEWVAARPAAAYTLTQVRPAGVSGTPLTLLA